MNKGTVFINIFSEFFLSENKEKLNSEKILDSSRNTFIVILCFFYFYSHFMLLSLSHVATQA